MTFPTQFNEGGPSGLGWSEVETYLRCPKEYQYSKVRGISRAQTNTPDYFAVGSFVHAGRARWFAEGFSTSDETWQKMRDDIAKVRSEFALPCSDLAETTALGYLQEYVNHWGVREKPRIVAVEHMLGPTPLFERDFAADRTARLDDFGFYPEAGGSLVIGECKTTSAAISDVANQYALHGQPMLQRLLWDIAPQGAAMYGAVSGTLLDVIQKGYGGKRCHFARIMVPVDARAMAWFKTNLAQALKRKARVTYSSDEERRVSSCTRLIGKARVGCEYRDLCSMGRAGAIGLSFADGSPITEPQYNIHDVNPWD